ncbi:MAG: hypothetical protein RIR86_2960, partial [Acidobacteriota bacterium]
MRTDWLPPELPQLTELLDPLVVERILARGPFAGLEMADLRLERIRYRPGRNCLLTWSVSVESVESTEGTESIGSRHRTHLSILAGRAGEGGGNLDQSLPVEAATAAGALPLPGLTALLWVFPQDRKLRGISALRAPETLLGDLAEEIPGIDRRSALEIVQYVAERSCTVRIKLRDGASWIYGKFYRPGESMRPWQLMNRLWQSESCRSGGLAIPAPLAHHPATESLWLQGLEGSPLAMSASIEQLAETGRALGRLHATPVDGLATITGAERAAQLERAIGTITLVRPDLRQRLATLSGNLATGGMEPGGMKPEGMKSEGMDSPATLHGDLHLANIFGLGEGRIGLLDLDNMVRGERWIDLASLAAYLAYHGLVARHDPD